MSDNLYAPVAELRERLGLTDLSQDFTLDRALQTASRWIDRTLGRRFYIPTVAEVRYYTACESYWYLEVDDFTSVTALATDANGDGVYETVWTVGTDYWLGPRNAPLNGEPYTCINKAWWSGRFSFPAWQDGVQVTGFPGYCALANCPPQIREFCLRLAGNSVGTSGSSGGASDLVIPGVQSYKIGTELTVVADPSSSKTLSPADRSLLDQFWRGGTAFIN
jgi:hypothetical protein